MPKTSPKHLVLLIVLLNGVFFAVQMGMVSQSFSDGTFIRTSNNTNAWQEHGATISVIDSEQNQLRDNDVILEVESIPLTEWVEGLFCFSDICPTSPSPDIHSNRELNYTIVRDGTAQVVTVRYHRYPFWQIIQQTVGGFTFNIVAYLMFFILLFRQMDEPSIQAMALMSSGFLSSLRWSFGLSVVDIFNPELFWTYQFSTQICYMLGLGGFLHFALVFPKPIPLVKRYPWLAVAPYMFLYLMGGILFFAEVLNTSNRLLWLAQANEISTILDIFISVSVILVIIYNYRLLKHEKERQQVRMVVFAVVLVLIFAIVLLYLPSILFRSHFISSDLVAFVALLIPITITIAIQRHRLWAIDPIINRTLVYLSLSAIIIGLYMAIVALTSRTLQTQTTTLNGLVATGIVAVIFQPLHKRLQKFVNRIMYGERDDPASVLSRLAHHLETIDTPLAILPNLVQTIAHALKIPYVAIWLPAANDQMEVVAEYGTPPEHREMIVLLYRNQSIGYLVVAPRGINERFNTSERTLLTTIAALTATTVRAVQLSDELRLSRQRIVTAREDERRRIRRDLHDGLGPQLASQTLALEAVAQLMPTNPEKAQVLLASLQSQSHEAMQDVRRLVYNLRPPALDNLGLIGALQQSASRYETGHLHFSFDIPATLPEFPAAVETALFRITQEAMTNVVRHAKAHQCIIRLYCTDHDIYVEIEDDGCGLPKTHSAGIGLHAMHERAAELNGKTIIEVLPQGGTRVQTRLPLEIAHD